MYAKFYGLSESAFALTPDPRYLFLSEPHKEALASATYGVQERKGFVLILGEVGTGKTTLIRHLLGRFGPDIKTVFVFNPAVSFLELLQIILRDLELPCPSLRRVEMLDALNDFLLKESAAGRYVVLIIDEAQHLSPAVLEEIRLLSNLETAHGKLIQILLVGQPELGEKLGRPELRQLRQRIGLVAELQPLSYKETVQYVAHRLEVAGRTGQRIFTYGALRTIYRASGGIPRLINVICDKALLLGYGADARAIGRRLVKQVLKDWAPFRRRSLRSDARARSRPTVRRGIHSWKPFRRVAAVALFGVAATALYLMLAGQRDGELLSRLRRALAAGTPGTVVVAGEAAPAAPVLPPRLVVARTETGAESSGDPPSSESRTIERIIDPPTPSETPAAPPGPPRPSSRPPASSDSRRGAGREIVVQPGEALAGLVTRHYGRADLTLLDFVRTANPEVTSIDVLRVGQRLKLPSFEPRALAASPDGSAVRLHIMTVWETESPAFHKLRAAIEASGRHVSMTPVRLTSSDTAYRIMVGDFAGRREAEAFYRTFRVPIETTSKLWR